jgi:hypothetical protein
MIRKFLEYIDQTAFDPISSFYIKDELNPKIWDDFKMKSEIKEDLLKIAYDFYESTDLTADIKDIILTGSLANYNWSQRYSDFDLHVVVDFNDISDDFDMVKKLTGYAKKLWALQYDIKLEGYEVELYIQDENEPHTSTGVYSILNDEWNVKPEKKTFEPNEKEIQDKAEPIIIMVDDIEENFDKLPLDEIKEKLDKVWDKIKNTRKRGLEEGEFGLGNLVFKLLRRNGYISKVIEMKRKLYIKQFS